MELKHQLVFVCLILPALCSSTNPFTNSKETFGYRNPNGACGYGEYGARINNGWVAAVSGNLWNAGSGCGACYQVKYTISQLRNDNRVTVVVTDYGAGDGTNFTLIPPAFSHLGHNTVASEQLKKYGVIVLAYRRVPCRYPGRNIVFMIQESSNNPSYFAVVLLNVGGAYDVTAIELWQRDRKQWSPLRRVYGAVFDYANPPMGEILLRFQVSGSSWTKWLQPKKPIPGNWKAGATYDTGVQLY